VTATRGTIGICDIGHGLTSTGGTIIITGGSVRCTSATNKILPQPTNGNSTDVYLNTLTVGNPAVTNTAITAGSIGGVDCSETPDAAGGVYGIRDVKTDASGIVYFYLPAAADQEVSLTANGADYTKTYTRTADGSTETLVLADITAPILSAGTVNRTSDTAATIGFTTNEAGTAYYLVVEKDATTPSVETFRETSLPLGAVAAGDVSGKTVILTAGAKDIYIVVEDAAGNISAPLKIAAAPYDISTDINSPAAQALRAVSTIRGLRISGLVTGEVFSVYTQQGQVLYKEKAIDSEQLVHIQVAGVYIVKAVTAQGVKTTKIIVQ
jgi:hypothetical protein